jgi:hypothetical protein
VQTRPRQVDAKQLAGKAASKASAMTKSKNVGGERAPALAWLAGLALFIKGR